MVPPCDLTIRRGPLLIHQGGPVHPGQPGFGHASTAGEQFRCCCRRDPVQLGDEDLDVIAAFQLPVQRAEVVQRQ